MMQDSSSVETLSRPFEASLDAALVIDESDHIVYANPAACRISGYRLDELLGRDAYAAMPPYARDTLRNAIRDHEATKEAGTILRGTSVLARPDGEEFEIEFTAVPLLLDGHCPVVVMFRDVTETHHLSRKVEALTRIAAHAAFAGSLEATLEKLAEHVVQATGTVAAGVCLVDENLEDLRIFGSYGFPKGPDVEARWKEAVRRGARLPNTDSVREKRTLIHANARQKLLNDPLYEPMHPVLRDAAWDTVVSVPLIYRNRGVGALNVFYPRGKNPGDAEVTFLAAIADQAAVAVMNAQLFEEAKEKAILEERQRLARELHDSVSQALYGIALGARTARTLLDRDPPQAVEPLDYVLSLAEAGLAEMRALIFELRPEALESEGLIAALTKQIESARARHGLEVHGEWSSEPDMPYEVKEAVYRIAQEALNNIIKHARARRVDVRLSSNPGEVLLEVNDDGVGFASENLSPGHLGLHSMRERAARLAGTLQVESAPAQGTRIRVRIPRNDSATA